MSDGNYQVYGGSYSSVTDAQVDFDSIHSYHKDHVIGGYEAAVFTKGDDGVVDIVNTRTPRRSHGAEWGVATGALVGILFPVSIVVAGAAAAAGGALIADWSKSFGRDDIRKMGETLDKGESGVVVVFDLKGDVTPEQMLSHALSTTAKAIPNSRAVHDELKDD